MACPTLTFDHERNTSNTMSERHAQHSHLTMWEHIHNLVRKAQHSHPIMGGTHPRTISKRLSTHIRPWEEHIQEPYRKGSVLISDHGRNTSNIHVRKAHPALTSDHGRNTSNNHVIKACPALTSDHGRNTSCIHVKKAQHSHLIMGGTNLVSMSDRLCTYIWPWEEHIPQPCQKGYALTSNHGRNTSNNHVKKACSKLRSNHGSNTSNNHVRKSQHSHPTMGGTHPRSM